jgi:hypothetical protein
MKHKYLAQIAVLLATSCVAASALAQWVWLDDHGVKQFTELAPPSNVPQNRILKQPHGSAIPAKTDGAEPKSEDATANDTTKGPMTTAEKEAEYKKKKKEQAEKEKKEADKAKQQQASADNCARTKSYLESLNSGARITNTNSNGERAFLSDEDRAKETAHAQEVLSDCNK